MHESLSGRGSLSMRAEELQACATWACRDTSVPGAGPVGVSGGRLVASGRGWGSGTSAVSTGSTQKSSNCAFKRKLRWDSGAGSGPCVFIPDLPRNPPFLRATASQAPSLDQTLSEPSKQTLAARLGKEQAVITERP